MSNLYLDEDAQPDPRYQLQRRLDRGLEELLGLCKGILADGDVVTDEARYLHAWLAENEEIRSEWPVDVLARRLAHILEDGVVDPVEQADLRDLLRRIVGGNERALIGKSVTTTLPLEIPPPEVDFAGRVFVFTGKFAFAPRSYCEDVTRQLGGRCESAITRRTHYLVLGTFASRDWVHTSFGNKIVKAVEYRDEKRLPLKIIGEDHWASAVSR